MIKCAGWFVVEVVLVVGCLVRVCVCWYWFTLRFICCLRCCLVDSVVINRFFVGGFLADFVCFIVTLIVVLVCFAVWLW